MSFRSFCFRSAQKVWHCSSGRHVDDILLTGSDLAGIIDTKMYLKCHFVTKYMGRSKYFLENWWPLLLYGGRRGFIGSQWRGSLFPNVTPFLLWLKAAGHFTDALVYHFSSSKNLVGHFWVEMTIDDVRIGNTISEEGSAVAARRSGDSSAIRGKRDATNEGSTTWSAE